MSPPRQRRVAGVLNPLLLPIPRPFDNNTLVALGNTVDLIAVTVQTCADLNYTARPGTARPVFANWISVTVFQSQKFQTSPLGYGTN